MEPEAYDPLPIVRSLAEEMRASGLRMEDERQMSRPLAQKMAEAGLFRLLVPQRYGGCEVHPRVFFEALEATARADPAVGWCLMIGTTTGSLSASLPEEHARALFEEHPSVITCGVTAPKGRATAVAGGLEVTGRWPFGSACQIADWITGGCFLYEDGARVEGKHGPRMLLAFLDPADVRIHDTWHTSGLCGTGSHDIEVDRAFVPEGRYVVLGGRPRVDTPLFRFPTFGLLALGVSAVSMGIAQRAIDAFAALAGGKVPAEGRRTLAERSSAQLDFATAIAKVRSARAYTMEAIEGAFAEARGEGRLSLETKAGLRLAATNNTWAAAEAVTLLYHAGGGSSIYRTNDLQRCFRDAHVTTQHVMVAKASLAAIGRVRLGVEPGTPL